MSGHDVLLKGMYYVVFSRRSSDASTVVVAKDHSVRSTTSSCSPRLDEGVLVVSFFMYVR